MLGNVFLGNEAYNAGAVINGRSDSEKQLTKGDFFGGNSAHGSGSAVLNGCASTEEIKAIFNRNKEA